jgi:hypothetical protein
MLRMTWHLSVLASALVFGCASSPKVPPVRTDYQLCGMYMTLTDDLEVVAKERASELFVQAEREARAGRHERAAEGFFEAAEIWRGTQNELLEKNLRLAYANAALCWLNAGEVETARARLLQAASEERQDPELEAQLGHAAEALPDPPGCQLR